MGAPSKQLLGFYIAKNFFSFLPEVGNCEAENGPHANTKRPSKQKQRTLKWISSCENKYDIENKICNPGKSSRSAIQQYDIIQTFGTFECFLDKSVA